MRPRVVLFALPPAGGDFFPISQGYIAASLNARGFPAAISEIDRINAHTGKSLAGFLLTFKPQIVGVTVYQANVKLALKLAAFVKQVYSGFVVVFGGPQITFMPAGALKQMPQVDLLCRGEGETVLPELAAALQSGTSLRKVRGIAWRRGNTVVDNPCASLVDDLDRFPSPYASGCFDFKEHAIACMLTSRGCTFNCAFCYTPRAYQRRIRAHSVRRVLADMRICVSRRIKRFYFADPSFTFDKQRVRAIMAGIIRLRRKVDIWCETRADLVDRSLLRLMARAGVKYIAYGLETVDPAVQKRIRKPVDLKQFEQAVRWTQEAGIKPEVFFLYGLPGQTYESCARTVAFLKHLGVELTGNSGGQQLNLFFGTDIQRTPSVFGIRLRHRPQAPYLSAGEDVVTDAMTSRQIRRAGRLKIILSESLRNTTIGHPR